MANGLYVQYLLRQLPSNASHVFCEANAAVNGMASLTPTSGFFFYSSSSLPYRIRAFITFDSIDDRMLDRDSLVRV